jgi:putative cell wall-binding protein
VTRTPPRRAQRLAALALSAALATGALIAGGAAAPAFAANQALEGGVTAANLDGTYSGLPNAEVTLYALQGSGDVATTVRTGIDGNFSLSAAPGKYRLAVSPHSFSNPDHARTWYGNTAHEAQGTVIEVGAAPITGLEVQVERGVSLSGTITYAAGVPEVGAAAAFLWNEQTRQFERFPFMASADGNGAYRITGLPQGTYALRFGDGTDAALTSTVYWDDEEFYLSSSPVEVAETDLTGYDAALGEGGIWVSRIAGVDRWDTSVKISETGLFEETNAVFIADGTNFPDALGAGPAAALIGAPVLLTAPSYLPASVKARLVELDTTGAAGEEPLDVIYIVGGKPSVSAAVEAELAQVAPVIRFEGVDRTDTSRQIAEAFWGETGSDTAYIATGNSFPDALAAAPAAANESAPVILVHGMANKLDAATGALLTDLGVTKSVIAGGGPSVSGGITNGLENLPLMKETSRRNGADRVQTSVFVNERSFPLADTVFIATGWNFPDALAGSAVAGGVRSPIYLSRPSCLPGNVVDEIFRLKASQVVLLGGEPSLSQDVEEGVIC